MNDNNLTFIISLLTFLLAMGLLWVVMARNEEIKELKREIETLEHQKVQLLQQRNEALMMAKHPEYFEEKDI